MKALKVILFSLCLYSPTIVLADLVDEITRGPASDEVVLDNSYSSSEWSDPIFSRQGSQRAVATISQEGQSSDADWSGELSVQREIPFTYPVVSVLTIQARALSEVEVQESKN